MSFPPPRPFPNPGPAPAPGGGSAPTAGLALAPLLKRRRGWEVAACRGARRGLRPHPEGLGRRRLERLGVRAGGAGWRARRAGGGAGCGQSFRGAERVGTTQPPARTRQSHPPQRIVRTSLPVVRPVSPRAWAGAPRRGGRFGDVGAEPAPSARSATDRIPAWSCSTSMTTARAVPSPPRPGCPRGRQQGGSRRRRRGAACAAERGPCPRRGCRGRRRVAHRCR